MTTPTQPALSAARVELPPGRREEPLKPGVNFRFFTRAEPPGPFRPTVNLLADPFFPPTTEQYITLCRLQFLKLLKTVRLPVDEPDPAGGHLSEWAAALPDKGLLRFRQRLVPTTADAYVPTATAPDDRFAALRPEIGAIQESFRPPAPSEPTS
jgi:hypothetical protein